MRSKGRDEGGGYIAEGMGTQATGSTRGHQKVYVTDLDGQQTRTIMLMALKAETGGL